MNVWKKIGKIVLYILLVLILFYQVMGLWGVATSDVKALKEATWLIPVWVMMVVLILAGLILYKVWKDKEYLPLITLGVSIVGAGLALIVALTLQAALPLQVAATTISQSGMQGLDGWKLMTRHYSPAVVGVVVAVLSFIQHKQAAEARVLKENDAYEEQFAGEESTLFGGDTPSVGAPKKDGKKRSKRQRKALREKEESGN